MTGRHASVKGPGHSRGTQPIDLAAHLLRVIEQILNNSGQQEQGAGLTFQQPGVEVDGVDRLAQHADDLTRSQESMGNRLARVAADLEQFTNGASKGSHAANPHLSGGLIAATP